MLAMMTGRVDGNALAAQNLKRAHEFRADVLRARRREFYRRVRLVTEEWQQARVAGMKTLHLLKTQRRRALGAAAAARADAARPRLPCRAAGRQRPGGAVRGRRA